MRFFAFQKKPLFNRGFRREILKVAIFDPPRKPPKNPIFDHFGHFGPPFWGHFLTPFWPPKNPKNDPFWPPPKPTPPKILENGPFGENRGFQARFEPQKGGGGGGLPRDPPKRPFLAIFGHFCPFWPFLPFLAIFGHFLTPQILAAKCERNWRFYPPKREKTPPETPLARQTISNNRVIRPQIWNLRRKRGFFCTPHRCGKCEWIWPQFHPVITQNI